VIRPAPRVSRASGVRREGEAGSPVAAEVARGAQQAARLLRGAGSCEDGADGGVRPAGGVPRRLRRPGG
jgi:hypothetical protein